MEKVTKILTQSNDKEYQIKGFAFAKLQNHFSGCFFHREEDGKIIVKPIKKYFNQMKSHIGRNAFKEIMV